jgi:hypothetical protein
LQQLLPHPLLPLPPLQPKMLLICPRHSPHPHPLRSRHLHRCLNISISLRLSL